MKNKKLLLILMASSMILSLNVSSAFVYASNGEVEENVIVSDEKKPVNTEKCSEQLRIAMNSEASIFEVQFAYTDIPTSETYGRINSMVDEYREKLEDEGVTPNEIAEKCGDYRKQLEAEIVQPMRTEYAEQILLDIGTDAKKAKIHQKTPNVDCDLNYEQLSNALEHELIYSIILRSEIVVPEKPSETMIPNEVVTTVSSDAQFTTTTTTVNEIVTTENKEMITDIERICEMLSSYIKENNFDARITTNEEYPGYQPIVFEYNTKHTVNEMPQNVLLIEFARENNIDINQVGFVPIINGVPITTSLPNTSTTTATSITTTTATVTTTSTTTISEQTTTFLANETTTTTTASIPSDTKEELPQTGYGNIYKTITGFAGSITIAGIMMIMRSKKKNEE